MTQISAPFDRVLGLVRRELADPTPNMEAIAELARIGQETVDKAQRSKVPGNDTGNQYEAFAFGVFFNGKCYRRGLGRDHDFHENAAGETKKGSAKDPKRGKYGFSEALHAIRGHHPEHRGYELYLTNAMWYSAYHEGWGLPVLSQEVKNAAAKIASTFDVDVYIDFYEYDRKN